MSLMEFVPFIIFAVVIVAMFNRKRIKNWLKELKERK